MSAARLDVHCATLKLSSRIPSEASLFNAWRRRVDAASDDGESVCKFQSF